MSCENQFMHIKDATNKQDGDLCYYCKNLSFLLIEIKSENIGFTRICYECIKKMYFGLKTRFESKEFKDNLDANNRAVESMLKGYYEVPEGQREMVKQNFDYE